MYLGNVSYFYFLLYEPNQQKQQIKYVNKKSYFIFTGSPLAFRMTGLSQPAFGSALPLAPVNTYIKHMIRFDKDYYNMNL